MKLFCHLRLPLYFVVPICVSEESILKYEGRGIPVSIYACEAGVNNCIEMIKFNKYSVTAFIFKTCF